MSDELKPCPWCSSNDIKIFHADGVEYAQCQDCASCGPDHTRGRHWNNFPSLSAQQSQESWRCVAPPCKCDASNYGRCAYSRAADQVNAEDYSKVPMGPVGATYIGDTLLPASQSSQPDTVAVPREQLEHWAEYWNGSANERAMSDALEHILGEVADLLRAAQEAK